MGETDLQGMIGQITKNPDLMAKIREIASGLGSSAAETSTSVETIAEPIAPPLQKKEGSFGARKQLLCALRPYLHDKRRKRLDDILNLLCLLEAAESSGILGQVLHSLRTTREEV